MLNIHTLTLGLFQTNCYVVYPDGADHCIVIDPGYEGKKILKFLEEKDLCLDAILLTHGHFDHVGAVKDLAEATGCRVCIRPEEQTMPKTMTAGTLYFSDYYPDSMEIAGMNIAVLHTPGHTHGSVCLIIEDAMFSGDTLFAGSCDRTDLPGGDWASIQTSLRKLRDLPGDYRVFPGHGEATTLAQERQCNPYLR